MNDKEKLKLVEYQIQREENNKKRHEIYEKLDEMRSSFDQKEIEINEKIYEIFSKTDEYKKLKPLIEMDDYYKCMKIKTRLYINGATNFDITVKDGEIVFVSATHDYEGEIFTYKEMCEHLYNHSKKCAGHSKRQIEAYTEELKRVEEYIKILGVRDGTGDNK